VSKLRIKSPDPLSLFNDLVSEERVLKLPIVRKQRHEDSGEELFGTPEDAYIEPGDVEFDASPHDLIRRLRRIHDNARTTVEERGVTTLYVTFGALHWKDQFLGDSVSPLCMVPAQLVSKGPDAPLRLSVSDEEVQLNPALVLYLRERHRINFPELPDELEKNLLIDFFQRATRATSEEHWKVSEEVWMSTFAFESLVIYQDLTTMADAATRHPIIIRLAGASAAADVSLALGEDLDEAQDRGIAPVPILPADSTQLEALTYGAAGCHLVIHGPPGTGKSQTITNFIAHALGQNKKILFVSAKMAALTVVYDRLAKIGLGQFCLEAHSTKAGKAKIIDELRRTLNADPCGDSGSLSEELQSLIRVRQVLNKYVRELHQKWQPFDISIYQAIGKLSKLSETPEVRARLPWPDPLSVGRQDLEKVLDAISELQSMASLFDARHAHPWCGFAATDIGVTQQEYVELLLRSLSQNGNRILNNSSSLAPILGEFALWSYSALEEFRTALESLAEADSLPADWKGESANNLERLATLCKTAEPLLSEFSKLEGEYHAFCSLPLRGAQELFSALNVRFQSWPRRIRPSYFRWKSFLRRHLKEGVKLEYDALLRYQFVVERLVELGTWLDRNHLVLDTKVGPTWTKDPRNLTRAAARFRSAALLQQAITTTGVTPLGKIETISPEVTKAITEILAELPSRNSYWKDLLRTVTNYWPDGIVEGSKVEDMPIVVWLPRVQDLLQNMGRLREWMLLNRVVKKCQGFGLQPFLDELSNIGGASLARRICEKRYYRLWVNAAICKCEHLSNFEGTRRQDLIEQFRVLDERVRKLALMRTQAAASETARRVRTAQDTPTQNSEVGTLRRELQKRKRIKPLRKLFAEMPNVLQALKPCMLMSPLSVSTFLKPGTIHFDVVVFDEASQLPTAEAVASILRADRVIVAGDANQLPPSSFFDASLLTDDNDTEEEEGQAAPEILESLLDDCVASVPMFQESELRWHYRSRDERLIKFSNYYFYDNRLITFPSACSDGGGQGVKLVHVAEGVWDKGKSRTNRAEARCVAKLVIDHFDKYADRSLGVVAMNIAQREAIEDAISEELRNRPDLESFFDKSKDAYFFVKSLENVQGDERDTMIISIGYGKDPNGALSLNFVPLNMDGGWRRFNVLVTRAKWQIVLVTSMRSYELHGVNPHNRGALALKNYIEYAERGAVFSADPATRTEAETNDFEDCVREALRERGLVVDEQVGASQFRIDLAIRDRRDSSRYVLGIECDGATYHGSRTARDRDLLRQHILERMGWKIHRVWSTEWFHEPQKALASILRSLEQAEAGPVEQLVEAPSGPMMRGADHSPYVESFGPVPLGQGTRRYAEGTPYTKCRLDRRQGDRNLLLRNGYVRLLTEDVAAIVVTESPIHEELLMERLKELHGVGRAGSRVQENIRVATNNAILYKHIERRGRSTFLWMAESTLATFRTPGDGVKRPLEWIAAEEIELAVLHLVEDQFGVSRDYLPQAVARIFGIERLRGEGADIIRDITDDLVQRGLLRVSGHQLHLA